MSGWLLYFLFVVILFGGLSIKHEAPPPKPRPIIQHPKPKPIPVGYHDMVIERMNEVREKNPKLWSEEAKQRREKEWSEWDAGPIRTSYAARIVPRSTSKQESPDMVRRRMNQIREENPHVWSEEAKQRREAEWTEWDSAPNWPHTLNSLEPITRYAVPEVNSGANEAGVPGRPGGYRTRPAGGSVQSAPLGDTSDSSPQTGSDSEFIFGENDDFPLL